MTKSSEDSAQLEQLRSQWEAAWPDALAIWSRFTKLTPPRWCFTVSDERQEGLADSFAMIRLSDQAVVVSLRQAIEDGLEAFATEVLAHEIGHHIYVPANLLDHGRMLARIRRGLPNREQWAPLIANLYADLLINDRLQRDAGLDMAGVYQRLGRKDQSPLWTFYLRTYEILWSLPSGTLTQPAAESSDAKSESHAPQKSESHAATESIVTPEIQADASLAARVVRSFAGEWLEGAGRYAVLCLTYLLDESMSKSLVYVLGGWCDTVSSGKNASEAPAGLVDIDADEAAGILHPMFDPDIAGVDIDADMDGMGRIGAVNQSDKLGGSPGQCREPFEYGQILRALGLDLTDHDIAVRYYRERALPHLVRFPVKQMPQSTEPLPEGLETWEFGGALGEIDWNATVLTSPVIVPGVTTKQRVWGVAEGADPGTRPIDLDLYVDCSGSMPNPQRQLSPVALAGAIIALSALRVGSAVQVTLWSGARQFETTNGFVRNTDRVLRVLTGFIGGGTAFPLHILRDTYAGRKVTDRAVHLLVISDDGVTTMLNKDERGTSGAEISAAALQAARGGGTMVLNLWRDWADDPGLVQLHEQGWDLQVVHGMDDLPPFAREFSRRRFDFDG
ncbi:MAG: hypothetical protein KDB14_23105 [Planctomycetales bacterium]|nr:hypothetical protein [Planctomycetales bacterium]